MSSKGSASRGRDFHHGKMGWCEGILPMGKGKLLEPAYFRRSEYGGPMLGVAHFDDRQPLAAGDSLCSRREHNHHKPGR
jgi:hypothetical protein